MHIFALEKSDLFTRLRTSEEGLGLSDVSGRLREFGPNILERPEKKNYIIEYLRQYIQFFAVLLEVAAVLSFITDSYAPGEGSDILGWAILGAVVINATFTFWQEYKADKAMQALLRLMPNMVNVRRDNRVCSIDSRDLVPGDIMLLEDGDKVAADGVLLECNSIYLNLSSLNGESVPAARSLVPGPAERPLDAMNMVFAGTTVTAGSGVAVAVTTGNGTEFGKIASLTRDIRHGLTPMQREIIHITRILTIIALIMGAVFFCLGLFSGKGILTASIFAISLIVANVPEGLLPTITLSLSLASQRMARRNALIKNLDSVETLGSTTVICSDKTGTLTKNEMTLKSIWLAGGELISISGEGYHDPGTFTPERENESTWTRLDKLLTCGLLNCRAGIDHDAVHGDPTELAIVAAARKKEVTAPDLQKLREHVFTSERKMMSTVYEDRGELRIFTKGAVEVILPRCNKFLAGDGTAQPLTREMIHQVEERAAAFENKAFRVLSLAHGSGEVESGLIFLGLAAIMDLPRPEVSRAIETCRRAGIRTMMITGDNPHTAVAVAGQIGLEFQRVITGHELETMDEEEIGEILKTEDVLFARMAGKQKLTIAMALQDNGETVAMTGDGVNDAPALKKADIGIAMGMSGTEVAKEAADMILLDDNFSSIVAAVEEGRTVYFNIKKFVTYILSSNVPEIVPYILQFFLKIPLPLAVIHILSIDLGSDMLPGLALGSERPEKNIMLRSPVGRQEKILDREVFRRGYFFLGILEATAAMAAFISFLLLHGWHYGVRVLDDPVLHRQAMTMTLLGAVSCQLLNAWTLRSWEFSAFSVGLLSNRLLLAAMLLELLWIWMLLNVPPVQKIFNTASVPLADMWILLPFPLLLFAGHECYKWFIRRKNRSVAL